MDKKKKHLAISHSPMPEQKHHPAVTHLLSVIHYTTLKHIFRQQVQTSTQAMWDCCRCVHSSDQLQICLFALCLIKAQSSVAIFTKELLNKHYDTLAYPLPTCTSQTLCAVPSISHKCAFFDLKASSSCLVMYVCVRVCESG